MDYVKEVWGRLPGGSCYQIYLYREGEAYYWAWTQHDTNLHGPYASEWAAIEAFERGDYEH